jgi:putative transposase
MVNRNITPSNYIGYGLYLYFSDLSLSRISGRLSCFVKRNHVSVWNWIQKYHPQKISSKRKKVANFIVDETIIKAGSEHVWLWVAFEPKDKAILALTVSKERNMFVAERFLLAIVKDYGKRPVPTDFDESRQRPPYIS